MKGNRLSEYYLESMMRIIAICLLPVLAGLGLMLPISNSQEPSNSQPPKVNDSRLVMELFAQAPDIVHPIGLDFDAKGRLLAIESHTHFRPQGYKGPKQDRIRRLEDTKNLGRADRITTFFEGTTATMDIAVHPDGSVYLATRNEILRLRDTKDTGQADEKQRIAFLDTKGDYPHNGLSGLCFDSRGNLYFGMGENLGAHYKLIGADGAVITGEGDGGHIFWCTADGKKLRRVATGFWNPFGVCQDVAGRVFAVDNDPDAMPPCRLVQVVEGGDYGFQFRYGRSGRHPFQAWNGELPGTLPMVSGTGEAPCEVVSYESDGLPAEYLGNLLVTSWADHRVERYILKEKGASFAAERKPFVQGGKDFHPVGLVVAQDGSLFVSDWVLKDYNLHGRGAIWHIKLREGKKVIRPTDPRAGLFSGHRPLREKSARQLAATDSGRDFLRQHLTNKDPRVRITSFMALNDQGAKLDLGGIAEREEVMGLRSLAVRALTERGGDVGQFLKHPVLKREALASLKTKETLPQLLEFLGDSDPFIRHAAVMQLASLPQLLDTVKIGEVRDSTQRVGLLLAWRASRHPQAARQIPQFMADENEDVRFLAAKWIADDRLEEHKDLVQKARKHAQVNLRMYRAFSTALARLEGQEVNEGKLADFFFERLMDETSTPESRLLALQLIPTNHPKLTLEFLLKLVSQENTDLRLEAVRTLAEHPSPKRDNLLVQVARNVQYSDATRAQAIGGLALRAQDHLDDLMAFTREDKRVVREEALRSLVETKLSEEHQRQLDNLAKARPETGDLIARVLGKPFLNNRPAAKDLDAWLKKLDGLGQPGDSAAGRRIFAHGKLAGCARCHAAEGRGANIGPDLSAIGRVDRRNILESILQPSNSVAPSYQVWLVETSDGRLRAGMLIGTYLDEYTYLDEKGGQFKVNTRDVTSTRPSPNSIMPDGLVDRLTLGELNDLMAYLSTRR